MIDLFKIIYFPSAVNANYVKDVIHSTWLGGVVYGSALNDVLSTIKPVPSDNYSYDHYAMRDIYQFYGRYLILPIINSLEELDVFKLDVRINPDKYPYLNIFKKRRVCLLWFNANSNSVFHEFYNIL